MPAPHGRAPGGPAASAHPTASAHFMALAHPAAPAHPGRLVPSLERAVLAHRGLPSAAPENTMAAFRAAADAGASWIETDVDLLADGTPVLIHDTALERTTDRGGSIYGLRAADLEHIDAGRWFGPDFVGERLPTLEAFVKQTRRLYRIVTQN